MSCCPRIGIGAESSDGLREVTAKQLTQGDVLEDLSQHRAHGDSYVLEVRGFAAVVQHFRAHAANAGERAAHDAQDLGDHDRVGVPRQPKTALGAAMARDEPAAALVRENVAEELGGQFLLLGELLGAHRVLARRLRQESAYCVVGLGRNLHSLSLLT